MFNKERLTLIALTLVALLLAGCGLFGSKSYDIVVRIEPPVEGVKIFVDGVHEATTEADGQVELKVKANAKLTAELEGYTFKKKEIKVTRPGEYVFEKTSPGRMRPIVSVKTVLEDIPVLQGETPFEDLGLPSTVEVVLDDYEEVEVAVDWTAAEEVYYNYESPGEYELEGVLVPGEGIINPYNITVKVKVVDKRLFDRWTVEVQSAYLDEIVFVIKALNKAGEAYDGWNEAPPITVNVKVDAEIDKDSEEITAAPLMDEDDWIQGVWTVTTEEIKFAEITEDVVATLTITGLVNEEGEEIEYVAETEPFLVDAKPTGIKVEADGQTYKSGETISLTLTLQYGDAKTVYTYNETSVVEVGFGTEAPVYNRQVTFVDGVGTLDVDAWKAASTVTVKLKDVDLEGSASITVEPGDPEILEATIVDGNIGLTLQDKFEQTVTWFEAENMKVQLAVKDEGEEAVGGSSTSVTGASPGWDGVAFVSFVKGKATIKFAGSVYQTWLHEEYDVETDGVVLIITLVVDEKNLTAEVDYKVPSS